MFLGKHKTRSTHLLRLCASLVLIVGYFLSAIAGPVGMTPLAVTAGSPAGSINLSEMENINLFNGQLSFAMPLLTIGGRGRVSHTITLPIQRRLQVLNIGIDRCSSGLCGEGCSPETCGLEFFKELQPVLTQPAFYAPVRLWGMREGVSLRDSSQSQIIYVATLSRFTLSMADGTELELRDKQTDGKPFECSFCQNPPGFARGTEFVSADGTSATFYSSDPIVDRRPGFATESPVPPYCGGTQQCITMLTPSGVVMMADGTRYDITQGRTTRMSDSNGNSINFNYTSQQIIGGGTTQFLSSITDPLDRQVTITYGIVTGNGYDEIKYKGFGGVDRSIKIYRQSLEATLLSGGTLPTKGQLYPELRPTDNTKDNPSVVSKVELANGRSYVFKYNNYGEPARLELPTGAVVEYTFDGGVQNGTVSGLYGDIFQIGSQETFLYRRLTERRLYVGGNLIGFTKYGKSDVWDANSTITRTSPLPFIEVKSFEAQNSTCYAAQNCQVLGVERHYFFSSAAQSYAGSPLSGNFKLSRYPFWKDGREFKAEVLDTDGTTVLQKQELTWDQAHSGWWNTMGAPEPPNNAKIVETKITIFSGGNSHVFKKSAINPSTGVAAFDQFHNQTDLWEYDFGNGAPGALLRHIHTDFVNDTSYTGSPLAGNAHLRRLPRSQTIYSINPLNNQDAAVVAASETVYDEAEYLAAPYDTLTGWVDPQRTACGNATTSKGWLNFDGTALQTYPQGTFVTTHAVYDQSGNIVTAIDPLGRESTVTFTDADGTNVRGNRAFGTVNTTPVPDSSGQHGSSTPFTVTHLFDHSTGLLVSSTDIRGQITTLEYNDSFSRPTRVVRPDGGGEITFDYVDDPANTQSPGTVFTKVRKQIDQNTWEEGFTYYDGLGRKIKVQSHDAIGDIFSETVYDSLGRVTKSSAPYRPGDTKLWVETIYDALGRTKEVISPKIASESVAAKITSEYSSCPLGIVTVGINQAGNKSRSITNALGQLIRVDEANGSNDLGPVDTPLQPTFYKYDAAGNLRRATQSSLDPDSPQFNPQVTHQSRFFLVDSLGRLIRVRQPEQETNSTLTISDPVTSNSTWSTGFKHLADGSVEQITDTKGVVTTFSYDNLSRVFQKAYSIPQTSDPKKITFATSTVTYKYDGTLSPAPNNLNPTVVPLAEGALTEIANGISTTQMTAFNSLGRVTSSQQVTDGQVYGFTYDYNFAGALTSETYPSGRTVTYGFDTAGSLSSVNSNVPNQAPVTFGSEFRYTPTGSIDQLKLGNNRWETYKSNARQQITEIALGTSATDTSLWRVQYDYGRVNTDGSVDVTKNDGNVVKQTITVPGVATSYVQTYKYDSINRLSEAYENSASNENWKQTFGYDRYGNRNSFSYQINQTAVALNNVNNPGIDPWTNRFSSGQGYEYDLNGNIIQDAQARKYSFDADNKQREIRDGSNQLIASYDYDGNGRRIKKGGAQPTVFVYDARGKLIAEYSNEPTPSGTTYITADILNSPRVLTNQNGDVISRRDFMPFGESIAASRSSNQKYGVADGLRKSFTGYERDDESQLDFAEARYYNPLHGRFTTVDPLLASGASINPQAFNRYAYSGNNPTFRTDPNGEAWYIYWVDRLVGTGSARVMLYEWHSDNRTLVGEVAREYVIRASFGKVQGLVALDPFENRFARVSSMEEGRAQIEEFKRQAARNFLVGAAEANSLILDLSGALDSTGVDRNSEQYKLGRNVGNIIQGVRAATGVGVVEFVSGKFGKIGLQVTRSAASKLLRKSLEAAGEAANFGDEAHHIVQWGRKSATEAMLILERFGIDINHAANGIFLDAATHARIKYKAYTEAVNEALRSAKTREDALRILGEIKEAIRNKTFPGVQ
jgi:RHS repeat-associated protein